MASQASYLVDIVLCVDCTYSMSPVIDNVKDNALAFASAIDERMVDKQKRIDQLRVRVIGFRDFFCDSEPLVETDGFIDLRENPEQFESFVSGLRADGGGDEPENSLEALSLAIRSDWADTSQAKGRRIVVLWTDASAHPLEKGVESQPPKYPEGMPANLDELTEMWEELSPASRRLLLYAPDTHPWSVIGASWQQSIHYPSQAGRGLDDVEFDAILDAIAHSI